MGSHSLWRPAGADSLENYGENYGEDIWFESGYFDFLENYLAILRYVANFDILDFKNYISKYIFLDFILNIYIKNLYFN